ncbi:hypothetical protein JST56_01200 [Candidatus Dependentiae bacterium]|nr:hypothetical protein [Candidatus Dependentiae bacterium]
MTGKALWQSLKKLVQYDQELIQLSESIVEKKKKIIEHHRKIADLVQHAAQLKAEFIAAKKDADMLQLQANSLREEEERKRDRLDSIRDQREYMALEKELSGLMRKRQELDDAAIKSWIRLEQAEDDQNNSVAMHEQKHNEIKLLIADDEQAIRDMQEKIQQYESQREAYALTIPEEWRVRYNRMRNQVPDPIVPVHGTCCSVCFYNALQQDVLKLKKQEILPCRNCYRFLYFDETQETEASKAQY